MLRDPGALAEQLDPREWELLQRYGQRGGRRAVDEAAVGRRISLSSRGLSNNEINRCLSRLRSIVAFANDTYELSLRDPTKHRFLPRTDPPRAWLRPDQFQALLDAAAELDARPARGEYAAHGRLSAVLVLGLAGPRASEFCNARWRDFRGSEAPPSDPPNSQRRVGWWFSACPRRADAGGPTILHLLHSTAFEEVSYIPSPFAFVTHICVVSKLVVPAPLGPGFV